MTMKKLFLTTALALCLASPCFACFAQDDGDAGTKPAQQSDNGTAQPQPDEDLTERPIPAGFQPNGDNDEATWSSVWSKSTSVDGNCVWHVRTTVKYKDPNRPDDWNEYSVKVPCDQNPPYVTGVDMPPIEYIDQPTGIELSSEEADQMLRLLLGLPDPEMQKLIDELNKILKDDPSAAEDLLGGSGANKQAKQEPSDAEKTAKDLQKILDQDPKAADSMLKGTAKSEAVETPNKSSDKPVKTEDKSRSTEDRSIQKTEGNAEHSLRSTAPEKIEAAKQVAHADSIKRMVETSVPAMHRITAHVSSTMTHDIGRLGGMGMMHTGGLAGMHTEGMSGLGGLHMGGMGGLGGMHLGGMGGLGGMHLGGMGGLGGMHIGGFGRM
jgi:hypothetical protein